MSRKMECPVCDAYTSSVALASDRGEPCPYCGLSVDAAAQVVEARRRKADADLTEQLTQAIVRADRAEAEAARLRRVVADIKRALSGINPQEET